MKVFNEYLSLEGMTELKQHFRENGQKILIKKNNLFFHRERLNNSIGLIVSGGFRYLSYTTQGESRTVGYSFENDFVVDYATFQKREKPIVDAQAISDSILLTISHQELNRFYEAYKDKQFARKAAEIWLGDIYKRMLSLYCDTPEERYLKIINQYPDLLNRVSLKEIASFISVTPETLSRIRRKIFRL